MRISEPHTFKSKHHNIKLHTTELVEHYYGLMMWQYEFYIDDQIVENKHIEKKNYGLVYNLDNFQLESGDGRFLFIPKGTTLIYDTLNKTYFETESTIEGENNNFVSNLYSHNQLIVIHNRGFQIVYLDDYKVINILFPSGKYYLQDAYYEGDDLYIKYTDLRNDKEQCRIFDFVSMDFKQ